MLRGRVLAAGSEFTDQSLKIFFGSSFLRFRKNIFVTAFKNTFLGSAGAIVMIVVTLSGDIIMIRRRNALTVGAIEELLVSVAERWGQTRVLVGVINPGCLVRTLFFVGFLVGTTGTVVGGFRGFAFAIQCKCIRPQGQTNLVSFVLDGVKDLMERKMFELKSVPSAESA